MALQLEDQLAGGDSVGVLDGVEDLPAGFGGVHATILAPHKKRGLKGPAAVSGTP